MTMNSVIPRLFENAPTFIGDVFSTTFKVIIGNWKSLAILALAEIGCYAITAVLVLGILYLTAAPAIDVAWSLLQNSLNLLDYSANKMKGVSRLLERMNDYDYDQDYGEYYKAAAFSVGIVIMIFVSVVILSLISSVFSGAFAHTLAEICAGGTSSPKKSIRFGMHKMCTLLIYHFLALLMYIGLGLVILFSAFVVSGLSSSGFVVIIIGELAFIAILVMISAGLTMAIPAIVVENKTATQAFSRSWNLSKNFICFIICNQFSYHLAAAVVELIIYTLLSYLPAVLIMVGNLCIVALKVAITRVLCFILYMSVRIHAESTTQEDLAVQIGSNVPIANAVEMSDGGGVNDRKGAYENLNTNTEMI